MKDALGKEIKIGDTVVSTLDRYVYKLFVGTVIDIKKKMVTVEFNSTSYANSNKVRNKYPEQLAIVEPIPNNNTPGTKMYYASDTI